MSTEILIIEDDIINQLIIRKLLSRHEVTTYEVENGAEGLEMLKKERNISYVVLDLNLPVMDGYTFIEHVSKDESLSHIKIFILSCNTKSAFTAKAQNRHIDIKQVVKYFEKPLMVEQLVEEIIADAKK